MESFLFCQIKNKVSFKRHNKKVNATMIYFTPGITQSVWMSLRESEPYGSTASFKFTFTNDISGEFKVFYPTDLQPTNQWSKFEIVVGTPENLATPKLNMRPGMWSYKVEADTTILETGKIIVNETTKIWTTLDRPAKNTKVLKR
jgi:hypothetical protein